MALDFSCSGGCTLFEVSGWIKSYMSETLYSCADYVQPSILGNKLIPILRKLKIKRNLNNAPVALVNQEAREILWLPTEKPHR